MKVAVVTPYYNESNEQLIRCNTSVVNQTHQAVSHIFVADGRPNAAFQQLMPAAEHIICSKNHNDAGATPRVLGALSAFSQGYDAVAFLDADNTYEPTHIELMQMHADQFDVVTATRNILALTGELLSVDTWESNGQTFCDTNCLFLTKNTINLLHTWIVDESCKLWSDRYFWLAVVNSSLSKFHIDIPTVNYYTKWAVHYKNAGVRPPPDSVWISQDPQGNLIHQLHRNILEIQ